MKFWESSADFQFISVFCLRQLLVWLPGAVVSVVQPIVRVALVVEKVFVPLGSVSSSASPEVPVAASVGPEETILLIEVGP